MQPFKQALTHIQNREFNEAIDILEELLLDDTSKPEILYNLGMCLSEKGEPEKSFKPLSPLEVENISIQ